MPRDGGGIYTLPGGNPVVPGTIIDTTWANPTMDDIAAAMSDSLSRSGKGGMTFSLRGPDGSAAVPTFSFTNETTSGRYRDGPGTIVEAVQGVPVVRYTSSGLEQWNASIPGWEPLTPRDALNTPFDPGPTALTSTNVQDAIEEVFSATGGTVTAANVTYDDTLVYFGAPTVQIAIDQLGVDLSAVASDVADNAGDIAIIEGEIDIIDSTILGMIGDINQNEVNIALNAAAIVNLGDDDDVQNARLDQAELDIIQNAGDIAGNTGIINQHTSLINANATNISNNTNAISQNASDISGNTTQIGINIDNIDDNTTLIGDIEDRFSGSDVLQVLYGGTGVTASTGSGSNVLNSSPALAGSPTAPTPALLDSSVRLATTAWVQTELSVGVTWELTSNANGIYYRNNRSAVIIQWGYVDVAANTTVTRSFPIAFPNSATDAQGLLCSYRITSTGEVDPPAIDAVSKSQFSLSNSMNVQRRISWLAYGY